MTDDLITWLRAQLDEVEQAANAAKTYSGRWRWDHGFGDMCNDPECSYGMLVDEADDATFDGGVVMHVHGYDVTEPWQGAQHIARHDPARVLADVAAKRLMLDFLDPADAPPGEGRYVAERAILLLALPYADRPGYRDEWRP